jgi:hypothetical protein
MDYALAPVMMPAISSFLTGSTVPLHECFSTYLSPGNFLPVCPDNFYSEILIYKVTKSVVGSPGIVTLAQPLLFGMYLLFFYSPYS